jgi:hypothetical protein
MSDTAAPPQELPEALISDNLPPDGPKRYELSYDKIVKYTLAQSNEMTIRFINGLLGDDLPLDASVTWLDMESVTKESAGNKHTAIIGDLYPRINGRMYAL